MKFAAAALMGLFALTATSAELPPLRIPEGVGVNIHFTTGHEKDLDRIAAAGFKWVRMDFSWDAIEHTKGTYDFTSYDALENDLKHLGLGIIFILDYSNGFYEQDVESDNPLWHTPEKGPGSPQHPDSIAAYARFATAGAKHFRGKKVIWEIWNEPNGLFWKPKPNAEQYAACALEAAKAIRTADKNALIIGPATSGMPFDFIETFLKSGVLKYINGVSVHPYRNDAPETAGDEYHKLRDMIDRYTPASRKNKIPILSGEWGYSTTVKGYSEETQANYAVRQQLFNILNGIPISIWYDWKNDGPDPGENEHNFGTVYQNLSPKKSYIALQEMTRELGGLSFKERLATKEPRDFVLLFSDGVRSKVASWTMDKPHSVTVNGATLALENKPSYQRWAR